MTKIRAKATELGGLPEPPRFVVDVMLGRLAKWLRIAGFDVLYSNRYTDDELISLSQSEQRVLLTRDTRLLLRRAVGPFVFLESERVREQIRQVFEAARIAELPGLFSRCITCNRVLYEISREDVRDRVPSYVFATQTLFKLCPECGRIFWAGTHRAAVLRALNDLLLNRSSG